VFNDLYAQVIAKEAGLAKELIVYEDQVERLKEENLKLVQQ